MSETKYMYVGCAKQEEEDGNNALHAEGEKNESKMESS